MSGMDTINMVCLAIIPIVIICCGIALIRNEFVFRTHNMIIDAIHRYQMKRLKDGAHIGDFEVEYDDMESYEATFIRVWDWGYTRILPPEKFEIIKPFIY